jgi:hypothetical protein
MKRDIDSSSGVMYEGRWVASRCDRESNRLIETSPLLRPRKAERYVYDLILDVCTCTGLCGNEERLILVELSDRGINRCSALQPKFQRVYLNLPFWESISIAYSGDEETRVAPRQSKRVDVEIWIIM